MSTVKKFFKYFLLFIGFFLFVQICTNVSMKERYNNVTKNIINISSPVITIEESKAAYTHGFIKGTIENDTGTHIKDKFLQFDFYDKDGFYVGTETQEIKYFNVGEKIKFNIEYKYVNIDKIEINFVDEIQKPQKKQLLFDSFCNIIET